MYIPASKASKQKRHQETRDFHESLVPMKKTLNEAGSYLVTGATIDSKGRVTAATENYYLTIVNALIFG